MLMSSVILCTLRSTYRPVCNISIHLITLLNILGKCSLNTNCHEVTLIMKLLIICNSAYASLQGEWHYYSSDTKHHKWHTTVITEPNIITYDVIFMLNKEPCLVLKASITCTSTFCGPWNHPLYLNTAFHSITILWTSTLGSKGNFFPYNKLREDIVSSTNILADLYRSETSTCLRRLQATRGWVPRDK